MFTIISLLRAYEISIQDKGRRRQRPSAPIISLPINELIARQLSSSGVVYILTNNQGGFPLTDSEGHRYGLRDRHILVISTRMSDGSSSEHLHGFRCRRFDGCWIESVVLQSNETAYIGNTLVLRALPGGRHVMLLISSSCISKSSIPRTAALRVEYVTSTVRPSYSADAALRRAHACMSGRTLQRMSFTSCPCPTSGPRAM